MVQDDDIKLVHSGESSDDNVVVSNTSATGNVSRTNQFPIAAVGSSTNTNPVSNLVSLPYGGGGLSMGTGEVVSVSLQPGDGSSSAVSHVVDGAGVNPATTIDATGYLTYQTKSTSDQDAQGLTRNNDKETKSQEGEGIRIEKPAESVALDVEDPVVGIRLKRRLKQASTEGSPRAEEAVASQDQSKDDASASRSSKPSTVNDPAPVNPSQDPAPVNPSQDDGDNDDVIRKALVKPSKADDEESEFDMVLDQENTPYMPGDRTIEEEEEEDEDFSKADALLAQQIAELGSQVCEDPIAATSAAQAAELKRLYEEEVNKKMAENIIAEDKKVWKTTLDWAKKIYALFDDEEQVDINFPRVETILALEFGRQIEIQGFNQLVQQLRFFQDRLWLSNTLIETTIRIIQASSPRPFEFIDSLYYSHAASPLPPIMAAAQASGMAISVIHVSGNHFCAIVLDFMRMEYVLFDPLQNRAVYKHLLSICKDMFWPLLRNVHPKMKERQFWDFEQKDGFNCGLYVIEFIHHYIQDILHRFRTDQDTQREQVRAQKLRLKYLGMIVSRSSIVRRRREKKKRKMKVEDVHDTKASDSGSDVVPVKKKASRVLNLTPSSPSVTSSKPSATLSPRNMPATPSSERSQQVTQFPTSPCFEEEEDSSEPATPSTVRPVPKLTTGKMSNTRLRNELVLFMNRHHNAGLSLGTILGYLVNHIDQSNRSYLNNLLDKMTDIEDGMYRLSAPYTALEQSPDDSKKRKQDDKSAATPAKKPRVTKSPSAGGPPPDGTPSSDGDGESSHQPSSSSEEKRRGVASGDGSSSPYQASSSDETETDTEGAAKSDLRKTLVELLDGTTGMTKTAIVNRVRKTTALSLVRIVEVLGQVAEEKNRRFYLKSSIQRQSADKPSTPQPPPTPKRKSPRFTSTPQPPTSPPPMSLSKPPAPTSPSLPFANRPTAIAPHPVTADQGSDMSSIESQDLWTPKIRKRLRQRTAAEIEAMQLEDDEYVVERILDLRMSKEKNPQPQYKVKWEKKLGEPRKPSAWLVAGEFNDITQFADQIKHIYGWKKSGLRKEDYFRQNPAARAYLDLTKHIAADGDGWCSFRAVGVALEKLTGKNPVTTQYIEAFQAEGLKRHPYRDEIKCGTRWPEVLAFIQRLCSKKIGHNIKIDYKELAKNRSLGGTGLMALKKCNLEPGVYLLAGHNVTQDAGHCVVLEIYKDKVGVFEEDVFGGVENLDWLHQVSYIRRFRLTTGQNAFGVF